MKNITKNQKLKTSGGFTIVELMVAMALFLVLVGIAAGAFIRALRTQRAIVELMAANDNASLTLEQMAREIRTGYNFNKVSSSELSFVNAYNIVVFYRLSEEAIERGTENVFLQRTYKKITADNLRVNDFRINLLGNESGDSYPPRITINLSISGKSKYFEGASVNVQTTISARLLDT
jgi:prepilin-type N-terminal cleavage/methylation domain-containing protein